MNMVIKCLLAALWLLAVPWAAGGTVFYKSKKKSMGMYLLAGYLLMFSVAELMILPICGSYGCGSCGRIYFYVQRKTYVRKR